MSESLSAELDALAVVFASGYFGGTDWFWQFWIGRLYIDPLTLNSSVA